MWQSIIDFFKSHMMACPSKKHFGLECLGCGFQRSFVMLLEGDLAGSFAMYPSLIPMLSMFLFLPIHLKWRIRNGHWILLTLFSVSVTLAICNLVYKLL